MLTIPQMITIAVAVIGASALLIVDHGPWNRPVVKGPAAVMSADTAAAAKAAGATVSPTDPRPVIEPIAPGPKPVQPAIPN